MRGDFDEDEDPDFEPDGVMKFYRFEDYGVSHGSEEYGFYSVRHVALREFRVIKETPKGAWIETTFSGDKRFVLRDARKQYACPTIELARQSFIARKKRQITILTKQLRNAEEALQEAESRRAVAESGAETETVMTTVRLVPQKSS